MGWAMVELLQGSIEPGAIGIRRGDCNDDGNVEISDGFCLLRWLFLNGETSACQAVMNTNGDDRTDRSSRPARSS